jgi:aspartyl-tRNA synthetase
MLTSIQDPIVEAFKFRLKGSAEEVNAFIRRFLDSPDAEAFIKNADGPPGVCIYDVRKPMEGLQIFGFEGAQNLKDHFEHIPKLKSNKKKEVYEVATSFDEGDVLIIQARENLPHSGGSTMLGKLRIALYKAAVAEGLVESDPRHHFLWVTDFPMFTLDNGVDPGQGGSAGFSATHHPFTAPKTAEDVDLLLTNPLKAKADHYDLVVNGVELGGGSRRIHNSEMQKFIMKEILKVRSLLIYLFIFLSFADFADISR